MDLSGSVAGAENPGQNHGSWFPRPGVPGGFPGVPAEGGLEQLEIVLTGRGAPIARSAGIRAVRRELFQVRAQRAGGCRAVAAEPPGQPVVRQRDGRHPVRQFRFMVPDPADLRDGEGGHRDQPGPAGKVVRPHFVGERGRGCRRAGVVPQQRRPHHVAGVIQQHHAVLLASHRQRADVRQPAGVVERFGQSPPPVVRVDFRSVRVSGPALADQRAAAGVQDHHLAALGGGVDAGNKGHGSSRHGISGRRAGAR